MRKGYVRARKIERNLPRKVEFQGTGKIAQLPKMKRKYTCNINKSQFPQQPVMYKKGIFYDILFFLYKKIEYL